MNSKFIFLFGIVLAAGTTSAWWGQSAIGWVATSDNSPVDPDTNDAAVDPGLQKVQTRYSSNIRDFLRRDCGNCHWGPDAEADFNLEKFTTLEQLLNGRSQWKKVAARVTAEEMPPEGETPLPDSDRESLLVWIDDLLNCVDCTKIYPGRVTIRRLNRTEYKNTIFDLVGVQYDPADDFPGDDEGYGFDNIADVISLPPILMEKYLQAAEDITSEAIIDPSIPAFTQLITGDQFQGGQGTKAYGRFNVLFAHGKITYELDIPESGKYEFFVRAFGDQAGSEPVKMSFGVDGKSLKTTAVHAKENDPRDYAFSAELDKGSIELEVCFLNDFYERDRGDRNLHVAGVTVQSAARTVPKIHRELIGETPDGLPAQRLAARKHLKVFTSRAYRRPVAGEELSRLMELYDQARTNGKGYELSLRLVFQAVLVSPHFLYKFETPAPRSEIRRLTDFELATSLSYFLWSSMPDRELFRLASQNQLRDPDVYRQQVERMIANPRSVALIENFVAQWLQLRHLEHCRPDPEVFPGIDETLRDDMATETKMVISDLIKRDASILEILDSDHTYLNQRLAEHYRIPDVHGEEFQRVASVKYGRQGVMTHASILTLTSNSTRTSPVKRGKWIMENFLGETPPPPDPEAMQLEDLGTVSGTLRQRLEQHRADPNCAVCHQVMDQFGFALENYDAVGRWRDTEGEYPIDATGRLPDGTIFNGATEFQQMLKTDMRDQFVRCITEKLLIYALGRGLEYFDECTVDKIIKQIEPTGFRFSDLILAVATSDPFLFRQGSITDDNR